MRRGYVFALEAIDAANDTAVITLAMHQEDITREGSSAAPSLDIRYLGVCRGPASHPRAGRSGWQASAGERVSADRS